jgi:hypothetical protein
VIIIETVISEYFPRFPEMHLVISLHKKVTLNIQDKGIKVKTDKITTHQWLMPVILVSWEAEMGRILTQG